MIDDGLRNERSAVVLIDGSCNLCNDWVHFLIPRDREKRLRFGAQQSKAGRDLLRGLGYVPAGRGASQMESHERGAGHEANNLESILFVEGDRVFEGSTAALRILRRTRAPWTGLAAIGLLMPRPIRDVVYRYVARNRYKWFGQRDSCQIMVGGFEDRFLADD